MCCSLVLLSGDRILWNRSVITDSLPTTRAVVVRLLPGVWTMENTVLRQLLCPSNHSIDLVKLDAANINLSGVLIAHETRLPARKIGAVVLLSALS